jgi:DNA-binding HxlR family transcriptional regulator
MILKAISKKYAKDIIYLLDDHGELYFTQILKFTKSHKASLSKVLTELVDCGLIARRCEEFSYEDHKIPKVYFKLTPKGKKIAKLLKKIDELEEELELSDNSVVIKGNVSGENIIIGNSNSTIHIKKH